MKNQKWIAMLIILLVFTIFFLLNIIDIWGFFALSGVWIIGYFIYSVGPETVTEITLWKASIKRDLNAAREIRNEIKEISKDLQSIVEITAETSYILANSSFLTMTGDSPAKNALEKNLDKLSEFFEPNKEAQNEWWDQLKERTYPNRQ